MKNYSIIFILLLYSTHINSQKGYSHPVKEHYNFSAVSMDEGLPNNFIEDIIKDSKGFIWLSTPGEGISRYDGYEFINCNTNTLNRKLKCNFIKTICEDSFGRIWAVSDMGIDILTSNNCVNADIKSKGNILKKIINTPANFIFKSSKGNLWIASKNKLYKIIFYNNGDIKNIVQILSLNPENTINTICEAEDFLIINNKNKVVKIKENASNLTKPELISKSLVFPENLSISKIIKKDNELWIGTPMGLFRYNLSSESIKSYTNDINNPYSISQNYITDIIETKEHNIIIGTFKGINVFDPTSDNFYRINKNNESFEIDLNTINCDFVNCLLADNGIVWIGTEVGGLNKMSPRSLSVNNYMHAPSIQSSISKNCVNAIFEDSGKSIWIGTVEGGLNRFIPEKKIFEHYTTNNGSMLNHNSVSCFTEDNKGRLWIGTWGGGIGWFNKTTKKYNHIVIPNRTDFNDALIGAICYDKINNVLWMGSSVNIFTYDLNTNTLAEPFKDNNIGGIEGCAGYLIDNNNLWIGLTKGLCLINLNTLKSEKLEYQLWEYKLDKPNSKLKERVSFIKKSSDGKIWIGSNGYGLYYSSIKADGTYSFTALTTEDGLINNSVRGIEEDDNGNIWISTLNGISCYDPNKKTFINYTKEDGLACNQFYWNSIYKVSSGDIFIGSIIGLTTINPINRKVPYSSISMAITHINIWNREDFVRNDIITMHERDKSLSIEFTALDYNSTNQAAYYYRLKGFDDKWIKASSSRRIATYTNLKSGKYCFELRYAPDGTHIINKTLQLRINVTPYFYKTFWFISLIIIIIVISIYYIIRLRVHSLKKQQELLHKKVEERTKELEEQKKRLSDQTIELSQKNTLLTQQNEKITKQKGQLIKMSKKVQELTIDKLSFFTNITHEFRTPLTLIIGPIEKALTLSYNPQVIEQLNFVERNSKYLLSLVNQLMDFRKIESGKMEIMRSPGNIIKCFNEIITPFIAYGEEKNIKISSHFRIKNEEIMFDEDALRKIMINLIGNALKFTSTGGEISIILSSLIHNDKSYLFIGVKDTGTGIPVEDINKVFNRFYQSQKNIGESFRGQSGTGIGLYLCKRIIQLHSGNITVKNNRKIGCSFRILLPIDIVSHSKENIKIIATENISKREIKPSNNKMNILIVEDNKDMRDYINSILRDSYNIIEAENGKKALDILHSGNIDFIISDLMMPVMDGLELSHAVKADFSLSHIPFLMLTAKTSDLSRLDSFKAGVDEYLLKPFDEELLKARINNILEIRKRLQQKFSINMDVNTLNIDTNSGDKKFLEKAMEVIKNNFQNSYWEISDFIEVMGVSRSLLNKKMQTLTGQSAGQFMRNYRLNIARELIIKTSENKSLNISEIAYEVGFNDPKYFTRCFTKHFGIAPSRMIEQNAEKLD